MFEKGKKDMGRICPVSKSKSKIHSVYAVFKHISRDNKPTNHNK